ncbi:hypothetical protein [Micromonospora inositola]|uniref:Uncharacterized protein n=1 Tax=Micromonospora inositola TaxID=47865 RepID=A0A1C5IPT0_9ACTN|nr:hypothetical protein [Micromonospora inositola]SCG59999.1 hypothetical protein GA0070613_3183 [Micromonospora inositola]
MVLYLFSGVLGWFVSPVLGVIGIVVMIVYHALTSEGVRRGAAAPPRGAPLTAGGPVPPGMGGRAGGRCGAVPGRRARTLGHHECPVHDAAPRRGELRLAPA